MRIYRPKSLYLTLGLAILLGGIVIASSLLYCRLAGVEVALGNGRNVAGSHIAQPGELTGLTLWCLAIGALGIPFIVYYLAASVTLDATTLTVRGGLGQVRFRATYDQLESVSDPVRANKEMYFVVTGTGGSVRISDSFRDFAGLLREISGRASMPRSETKA